MANFDLFDDNFGDIFLTQSVGSNICISLREDGQVPLEYNTVRDPQYSDISDFEEDTFGDKMRYGFPS